MALFNYYYFFGSVFILLPRWVSSIVLSSCLPILFNPKIIIFFLYIFYFFAGTFYYLAEHSVVWFFGFCFFSPLVSSTFIIDHWSVFSHGCFKICQMMPTLPSSRCWHVSIGLSLCWVRRGVLGPVCSPLTSWWWQWGLQLLEVMKVLTLLTLPQEGARGSCILPSGDGSPGFPCGLQRYCQEG